MKYLVEECEIKSIVKIAENIFDVSIINEKIAKLSKPGQFLHIKCGDQNILRRPISICDVLGNEIRFIFEVKGEGTLWLSLRKKGEFLDIMGPLGNGFTILDKTKKACFVGGGIGVFPLLYAAKNYNDPTVCIGFRSKAQVTMETDFKEISNDVYIMTDDGSYGEKGLVTNALLKAIDKLDIVYACGPKAMLKAVSAVCKEHGVLCEVSLEERMGCGIGACLVCACKIKKGENTDVLHVCKNGPVFKGEEVLFDE